MTLVDRRRPVGSAVSRADDCIWLQLRRPLSSLRNHILPHRKTLETEPPIPARTSHVVVEQRLAHILGRPSYLQTINTITFDLPCLAQVAQFARGRAQDSAADFVLTSWSQMVSPNQGNNIIMQESCPEPLGLHT